MAKWASVLGGRSKAHLLRKTASLKNTWKDWASESLWTLQIHFCAPKLRVSSIYRMLDRRKHCKMERGLSVTCGFLWVRLALAAGAAQFVAKFSKNVR